MAAHGMTDPIDQQIHVVALAARRLRRLQRHDGVSLTVNGKHGCCRGRAAHASGRFPARDAQSYRHPSRLRAWRLRRLHGPGRRRAGAILHHLCGFVATAPSVTTIEGLDDDEIATELRAAFTREHALQCGYCTPGMLVSARDLVAARAKRRRARIRVAMSGNLCRCTGYVGMVVRSRASLPTGAPGALRRSPVPGAQSSGPRVPDAQAMAPAFAAARTGTSSFAPT